MLRYKLCTLLIVLALGPPMLAWGWFAYRDYCQRQADKTWDEVLVTSGFLPMAPYGDANDGVMTMTPQR